jgi:hypothetical protein
MREAVMVLVPMPSPRKKITFFAAGGRTGSEVPQAPRPNAVITSRAADLRLN